MAIVLYARVSTSEQTIDHQRTQAEKAGFNLDQVIWDEGVSGVSTKLAERPQGRRLFDLLRNGDTLVVRWVDRLGRNYQDICDTIREFMRRGVVIRTVINGITFDGATKDASVESVQDGCHVVDTANRPWPTGVAPRGGGFPVGQRLARSLPERWPAVLPRGGS